MSIFEIAALILTAAALGGYLNFKFVRLPATIGHMAFALLFSGIVIGIGELGWLNVDIIRDVVGRIDFSDVVLHGMLSFLLFAGALHINLDELTDAKWPIGILATVGVMLATFIIGTLTWYTSHLVGIDLPYNYALLFGALISPTDPIAVLSILKQISVSKKLYIKIGGESLFNDGIGVVLFIAILATAHGKADINIADFIVHLLKESLGGLGLGFILGWLTYQLMRSIDDYKVEVMLSLALVMGGYALAEFVHVSAPLCMVTAGLIIGNQARSGAMSENTRNHLDIFWELIDEILNAVLFLLVGLEILVITLSGKAVELGLLAVPVVLVGRFISVALPVALMRFGREFERGTIRLLTWGGLRGGLSIAMALSIPAGPEKSIILTLTYIVVVFSIFVQGLSFKRFVQLTFKE